MDKLTSLYTEMVRQNALIRTLMVVIPSFDESFPNREAFREFHKQLFVVEEGAPEWYAHFHSQEPPALPEILGSIVESKVDAVDALDLLRPFLCTVLYGTSGFLLSIDKENAHQACIGDPRALWIHDMANNVLACCIANMFLLRLAHPRPDETTPAEIPDYLLRIPICLQRYQEYLLPWMRKIHEETLKAFENKSYLQLFTQKTCDNPSLTPNCESETQEA